MPARKPPSGAALTLAQASGSSGKERPKRSRATRTQAARSVSSTERSLAASMMGVDLLLAGDGRGGKAAAMKAAGGSTWRRGRRWARRKWRGDSDCGGPPRC